MSNAYLSTLDILVISSATGNSTAITPLSSGEQAAVTSFINNGGRFLIISDNSTFSGVPQTEQANASILAPVGMTPGGLTFAGLQPINTTGPATHPILDGRSGTWTSAQTNFPGTWGSAGAATVLANVGGNPAHPALAAFGVGDVSPLSARGVVISDLNAVDFGSNLVMTNNIVDYLIPTVQQLIPEPSRSLLSMVALGAIVFRRRRG